MKKNLITLTASIILLSLSSVNSTFATTATTTMNITSSVPATCTIAAQDLNFGPYTGTDTAATTSVNLTCTDGTAAIISFDQGANVNVSTAANSTDRYLAGSSSGGLLKYNMYAGTNTNVGLNFGSGGSYGGTLSVTADGTNQSLALNGVIPAGQNVPADSYSDTVNLTVTY